MSKRTKNRYAKKLGEEAKAKASFFKKYLDKEIILTGRIMAVRDVLSTNFIGKSVLFSIFNNQDVDHIWIHMNEFKNYDVENENWNNPITIKGIVYSYSRDYRDKVWHIKYSLKNVEAI